jgi:hypothetical protein
MVEVDDIDHFIDDDSDFFSVYSFSDKMDEFSDK